MKTSIIPILIGLFLIFSSPARGDEGMWLVNLLQGNMEEMKKLGLKLSEDQIYSINNSSLKDAIGSLDNGSCTGELVSSEGLLLTNHHCAYEEIQKHSSIEHDYLKNGFWAMDHEMELPNPGKTISFLVRIEDVTDQIIPNLDKELSGFTLENEIDKLSKSIVTKAIEGTTYEASVKSFFDGNKYFMIVLQTYKDLRLVGTPPESIGKFGADTDNWMWPRHTGDFAIFRVYTGPDGNPAEYSPSNVPLKSKKFLSISIKGYQKGDFTLVMGYPGTTHRYMTSFEINEALNIEHPARVLVRGKRQEIMLEDMKKSEKVRIQYSSKYSTSSNYWKNSIGQIQGLNRLNVVNLKLLQQDKFTNWVNENPDRKVKYSNALKLIEEGIIGRKDAETGRQFVFEAVYIGMESSAFALKFLKLYNVLSESPDNTDSIKVLKTTLIKEMSDFYKDYNLTTDKKISKAMLQLVKENLPVNYQMDIFQLIDKKFSGDIDKFIEDYYRKSIFPYEDKLNSFLAKPKASVLVKDPAFKVAVSMIQALRIYYIMAKEYDTKILEGRKLWLEGLMEMDPGKKFYSDANSTMRLTYGTIGGYEPRDAVYYSYITTLDGVMEKEDPSNWEFIVSERLKEFYKSKDYGRYGEDGKLVVCFISNNDITGGNSGSPVMNSKGELIGIAFDGNWEAMSGDIEFEEKMQKCINVDIRYVLFVIDKFAGASHLINEMTIIE